MWYDAYVCTMYLTYKVKKKKKKKKPGCLYIEVFVYVVKDC